MCAFDYGIITGLTVSRGEILSLPDTFLDTNRLDQIRERERRAFVE